MSTQHNNIPFLRAQTEATEAVLKKNKFMGKLQQMDLSQYVTDMRTLFNEIDRLKALLKQ